MSKELSIRLRSSSKCLMSASGMKGPLLCKGCMSCELFAAARRRVMPRHASPHAAWHVRQQHGQLCHAEDSGKMPGKLSFCDIMISTCKQGNTVSLPHMCCKFESHQAAWNGSRPFDVFFAPGSCATPEWLLPGCSRQQVCQGRIHSACATVVAQSSAPE